jgi:hypothetical protein
MTEPLNNSDKEFYEWIVDTSRRQMAVPHLEVWRAGYQAGMAAVFAALEDSFLNPPSRSE